MQYVGTHNNAIAHYSCAGPGATITVNLSQEVQFANKRGIITLLNNKGLKVDGVSYTAPQAQKEGWTIVF